MISNLILFALFYHETKNWYYKGTFSTFFHYHLTETVCKGHSLEFDVDGRFILWDWGSISYIIDMRASLQDLVLHLGWKSLRPLNLQFLCDRLYFDLTQLSRKWCRLFVRGRIFFWYSPYFYAWCSGHCWTLLWHFYTLLNQRYFASLVSEYQIGSILGEKQYYRTTQKGVRVSLSPWQAVLINYSQTFCNVNHALFGIITLKTILVLL